MGEGGRRGGLGGGRAETLRRGGRWWLRGVGGEVGEKF